MRRSLNPRVNGRCRSRQVNGRHFDEATRLAVWRRARKVAGKDPDLFRKDAFGCEVEWARYGEMVSMGAGWEIDHVQPVAQGGDDGLANLQVLHWQNNRWKGDIWPDWQQMPIFTTSEHPPRRPRKPRR